MKVKPEFCVAGCWFKKPLTQPETVGKAFPGNSLLTNLSPRPEPIGMPCPETPSSPNPSSAGMGNDHDPREHFRRKHRFEPCNNTRHTFRLKDHEHWPDSTDPLLTSLQLGYNYRHRQDQQKNHFWYFRQEQRSDQEQLVLHYYLFRKKWRKEEFL